MAWITEVMLTDGRFHYCTGEVGTSAITSCPRTILFGVLVVRLELICLCLPIHLFLLSVIFTQFFVAARMMPLILLVVAY